MSILNIVDPNAAVVFAVARNRKGEEWKQGHTMFVEDARDWVKSFIANPNISAVFIQVRTVDAVHQWRPGKGWATKAA